MDIETEGSLGLTVYQHQSKLSEEFISEESGQSDRVVSLSFYVAFFTHYYVHMCTQTPTGIHWHRRPLPEYNTSSTDNKSIFSSIFYAQH